MIDATLIADLVRAGLDPELIARVSMVIATAQSDRDALAARRSNDAERQRRHVISRASREAPLSSSLIHTPIEEEERKKERKKEHAHVSNVSSREFDEFWQLYPNKVGKPAARRAFPVALRKVSLADLIVGLRRYMVHKPTDRPWLNPATFLNQERWADQPAPVGEAVKGVDPYAPPPGCETDQEIRSRLNGQGTEF